MKHTLQIGVLCLLVLCMTCSILGCSPHTPAPQPQTESAATAAGVSVAVPADKEETYLFSGTWVSDDDETVIPILVHLYEDGTLVLEAHENKAGGWTKNADGSLSLTIDGEPYTAKYSENLKTMFFRYNGTMGTEEFSVQMTVARDPIVVAKENDEAIIRAFASEVKRLIQFYDGRTGEIIFYGGSNFAKWETLAEDLAPYPVQNKSFGGSNDVSRNYYMQELICDSEPKILVMFNDTNNWTSGQTLETVTSYRETMLDELQKRIPDCVVLYLSNTPNPLRYFGEYHDKSVASDEWTKEYCESHPNMEYLDIVTPLTQNGQPVAAYWQADNLHLTETGYQVLAQVVRAKLDEICATYGIAFGIEP